MTPGLLIVAYLSLAAPPEPRLPSNDQLNGSVAVCFFDGLRAQLVGEIRAEQKAAAELSGFVDARKLYDLQQQVRYVDKRKSEVLAVLKAKGEKPLSCKDRYVALVALCVEFVVMNTLPSGGTREEAEAFCGIPEIAATVTAFREAAGEKAPYWKGAAQAISDLAAERPPPIKQPTKL